jgi:hypothetical protein
VPTRNQFEATENLTPKGEKASCIPEDDAFFLF